METTLKIGMEVKSTSLDCIHVITNVTDKKVCYTPKNANGGLKVNKNTIRIYTTSVRIANEWLNSNKWVIQ